MAVRLFAPPGIAPNITRGPQDSTVIDGMSVILNCETSGAPRPAITWQKGKGAGGYGGAGSPGWSLQTHNPRVWSLGMCPLCSADGWVLRVMGPPPCHPGERILASGSVQLPRFTLLESGSLLVSPAHLADAGTYTCLATNSRGVDEASADLVVWGKAPVALRSGMPGMGTGTLLGCLEGC